MIVFRWFCWKAWCTKGTGQGPQRRHPAWVCLRSGSERREVACGFTTRVLQTFLDTKPGNKTELVAHCTDELPVVGTLTPGRPLARAWCKDKHKNDQSVIILHNFCLKVGIFLPEKIHLEEKFVSWAYKWW